MIPQFELVIDSVPESFPEGGIQLSWVESTLEPERVVRSDLATLRRAVLHRNSGVKSSAAIDGIEDAVRRLKVLGVRFRIERKV